MAVEVLHSSIVPRTPEQVWAAVSTLHGVNQELRPYVVMREPAALRGRTLASFASGETAHCLMLAGGIVPFDRHRLGFESVTPGVGFVEESTSWLQLRWRHERTIEAVGEGARITDHVTAEPRLAFLAPVVEAIVARLFAHRHRRLAARFAEPASVARRDADDPTLQTGGGAGAAMIARDLAFIETAPLRVEATQVVDAPPERVWAVLADHRRWPEWFGPALLACQPTSTAETGVGSSRVVRLRGGTAIAERFIAWDPPELWAFTGTASRPKVFMELVERARLENLGDGRTRITYTLAATPNRVLRWAVPVLQGGIARSLAESLRGLANRAVES